jgi:hypothetical protein
MELTVLLVLTVVRIVSLGWVFRSIIVMQFVGHGGRRRNAVRNASSSYECLGWSSSHLHPQ